mmetsp:Transcript_24160/g.58951  ORF Transcript_24160/g.58951 Transcript_24160/m.58951 type:complete len:169 (-) Transcript_24160:57-563(-)
MRTRRVVRSDVNAIRIGAKSTLGDDVVVHARGATHANAAPRGTTIGDSVVVEQGAILHACDVHDGAWIHAGAIVLDGGVVERDAVLGPGAVLTGGKTVPAGEYWAGHPAQRVRKLTDDELHAQRERASTLVAMARKHDDELVKTAEQLQRDKEFWRPPGTGRGFDADV